VTIERQSLGRWGEEQAVRFLSARRWKILQRNVRTPVGELDIVARDGRTLVFVEVKTRRSAAFGAPQEAVGLRKQRQIVRAAQWFLAQAGNPSGLLRFDVIAVMPAAEGARIEHLPAAFGLDGAV
jgi:putative endonuclease